MKSDVNGCSTCPRGQEQYETLKNINLCNGNPNAWISAVELTDEQIEICLDAIGQINVLHGSPCITADEDDRIAKAIEAAETCDDDRDYIRRWANSYGELVIG